MIPYCGKLLALATVPATHPLAKEAGYGCFATVPRSPGCRKGGWRRYAFNCFERQRIPSLSALGYLFGIKFDAAGSPCCHGYDLNGKVTAVDAEDRTVLHCAPILEVLVEN